MADPRDRGFFPQQDARNDQLANMTNEEKVDLKEDLKNEITNLNSVIRDQEQIFERTYPPGGAAVRPTIPPRPRIRMPTIGAMFGDPVTTDQLIHYYDLEIRRARQILDDYRKANVVGGRSRRNRRSRRTSRKNRRARKSRRN